MSTKGDRIQDRSLAAIGGKGLFIKELETALEDRRADMAVHSMKDVPGDLPDALVIAAVLPRADARDALISSGARKLEDLPQGARLGTSSLRRQAQLLAARPDLDDRGAARQRRYPPETARCRRIGCDRARLCGT